MFNTEHPARVVILDDHDEVRAALRHLLNAAGDLRVVADTADAEVGLRLVYDLRPDLVLLESKRSDGRGLEMISWLAQSGLRAQIVVLTSYPSEWERWAAHRAGARLYLLKEIGSPQLIENLRHLLGADSAPHSIAP